MGNSLKKEFVSGVFYTSLAKYSGIVVQLIVTAILARLIDPGDFGVVAVATVVINLFNTFSDAGLGPAIIQHKEFSKKDYNSIFTFSLVLGLLFMAAFYLSSGFIGRYYEDLRLINVCKWLSVLVLLSSLDVVPNSILYKDKKFDIIAYRTLSVQIVVGIISIYVAYKGWGIYALVLSAVLSKAIVFSFNYIMNPLKICFHFRVLNTIKSYSFFQFMCNLMAYFGRNLDKLVVGKILGMKDLGYYEKSYKLMMLPLQNITLVITPVLQPIFSDFQNNLNKLMDNYLKLCKCLALIAFPITVVVFFCSEELVLLFFGNNWEPAVAPFRILSLSIEIQIIQSSCGAIFQSSNNTKGLFFSSLASLIIMVLGLIVAAYVFKDLNSVAWSFVITNTIGVAIVFVVLFKSFGRSIFELLRILKRPFVLMGIEFLIMWILSYFKIDNLFVSLIVKGLEWIILTLVLFLALKLVTWSQIKSYLLIIKLKIFSKKKNG